MRKIEPVTYILTDNTVLSVIHSYEAVCDGVMRIETTFEIDGKTIGNMLSFSGKLTELRFAPVDFGLEAFLERTDHGYAHIDRFSVKRTDMNLIVSELHLTDNVAFSSVAEYIFDNLFRFFTDTGFVFNKAVYANLQLGYGKEWDYSLEERHETLIRRLKALVVNYK